MSTTEGKPETNAEKESTLTCVRCGATKYCPDCTKSYKEEHNFCSKCGKPLQTLEAFENKNCPVCDKDTLKSFCKVLKITTFEMPAMSEEEWKQVMLPRGGIKVTNYCDCGHYRPCSTHGVIDDSCANCGGKPRPVVCR